MTDTTEQKALALVNAEQAKSGCLPIGAYHGPCMKALCRAIEQHEALEAQNQRLSYNGIHTCSDECQRLPCVQRREIDRLKAEIERLGSVVDALLQHDASSFWGADAEKNRRASYRGVIRKAKKARAALGEKQ